MKKIRFLFVVFTGVILLSLLTVSCEKEVDFEGQLPSNKLVLNCFVDVDSFITANVSRSWNLSQEKGEPLRDAEVSLYINDEFQTLMQPADPQLLYPTHQSQSRAKEGDIIKIIAKKAGYPDVSAQTVLPGRAKILSVDTIRFSSQYSYNSLRFLINFRDLDAGKKNYYRLVVEQLSSTDKINWIYNFTSVYYDYDQDIALRDGFENATEEMLEAGTENVYGIFNDETFDGKEYTLNVSFQPSYGYGYGGSGDSGDALYFRYRFKLVTLSESSYLYLKSRTYYDYNGDDNPFTEPTTIFSNVTNGLGILGGFQVDAVDIDMPPVINSGYY